VSGGTLRASDLGGRRDGPSGHGMAERGVAVGLWGRCFRLGILPVRRNLQAWWVD